MEAEFVMAFFVGRVSKKAVLKNPISLDDPVFSDPVLHLFAKAKAFLVLFALLGLIAQAVMVRSLYVNMEFVHIGEEVKGVVFDLERTALIEFGDLDVAYEKIGGLEFEAIYSI